MGRRKDTTFVAPEVLMQAGEVAKVFRVDPKTPARWAHANLIPTIKSPGGHHRFRRSDIVGMVGEDVLTGKDMLMCSDEVADLFRVDEKTAVRWATEGKLDSVRTPSGHHRFLQSVVMSFLEVQTPLDVPTP